MGLITKALGFNALSIEDPAQPLMPYGSLYESLGLGRSDAGILVNSKQAERYSTVFACCKVISEDLAGTDLDIFQQMSDGSLRLATDHKNYYQLHTRPNPNMSSMEWRGAMLWNVCLHGNGYSWLKRDNAARIVSFIPLSPTRTSLVMRDGVLMYATTQTASGVPAYIDIADMVHFKANSLDGMTGRSPLQLCHNMVGLGLAAEKFGAQLFGNGSRTTGIFTHPQRLDPEAYENLKKSLYEVATGDNALRPLILEEGLTYQQLTINPADAQLLELRRFTKEDVAQTFRVPLHKLQDLQKATNANLEFQGTDYVRNCLAAYATQIEQELMFKVLGKGPFIIEHNLQKLSSGDTATQTAALISLRNAGIYSGNEVLRSLRKNPIPADEGGDIRLVQGAFIPLDSLLDYVAPSKQTPASQQPAPDTDPSEGDAVGYRKAQFVAAYRPLFRDAVGRSIHRANDSDFVKKAFQPTVASMLLGFLARFGQGELTDRDHARVGLVVADIASQSSDWTKENASNTATNLTEAVYMALTEETNA